MKQETNGAAKRYVQRKEQRVCDRGWSRPLDVTVADVNGDGNLDLIVEHDTVFGPGPPGAFFAKVRTALRGPTASGVKVTLTVHVPAETSGVVRVLVWEESPGFVPANEIPEIVTVFEVLLVHRHRLRRGGGSHADAGKS
jgi:hypothetical protein